MYNLSKVLWSHFPHLMIYVLPWDGSEVNRTLFTLQVYRISLLVQLHQSYQFSLLKSQGWSREATGGEVHDPTKCNAFLRHLEWERCSTVILGSSLHTFHPSDHHPGLSGYCDLSCSKPALCDFNIQIYWIADWPGHSLPASCSFMQEDIYLTL